MLDIFNKIQTIYNWSSNTDTKTNQIYTWFSNIYNELNSTSTSYMKGKINSIYSNMISSSSGGIKRVQSGLYAFGLDTAEAVTINHNTTNVEKSFIILEGIYDPSYGGTPGVITRRTNTSFSFGYSNHYFKTAYKNNRFCWQIIEFY